MIERKQNGPKKAVMTDSNPTSSPDSGAATTASTEKGIVAAADEQCPISSVPPELDHLDQTEPSEAPPIVNKPFASEQRVIATGDVQAVNSEEAPRTFTDVSEKPLAPQRLPAIQSEQPQSQRTPTPPAVDSVIAGSRQTVIETAQLSHELNSELESSPPSIPSAAALEQNLNPGVKLSAVGSQALPGDVIAGRYSVQGVLGEGGMGIVYRCHDQHAGEVIALKRVVVPDIEHADEYIMWFYKEARALAAVDHPAIVGARDFGRLKDGSPYLAMDLAEGVSLHDLMHAGLGWPAIWHVVDQVLGALGHAHARGIIHGDLKPSNVLVEEVAGEPPLVHMLDFGLAWLKADPHDERLDGAKALEFKPHAGAGTPGYMAPEQIQHEQHHITGATDLYALGCILYRLIGRGPPFGGTSKELLRAHAYSEVPRLVPAIDLPSGALQFVMQLLKKRAWDRFEYAAQAREQWAELRPVDVDPSHFVLPKIRPAAARALPKGQGEPGRNPLLDADSEGAVGLLSIRQSPLVGRHGIRQTLREACDELIDDVGQKHRLVILVGPAGSGKSRIAEWLCESVHEEGSMIPLYARYRRSRGPLDGIVGAITRHYNFERSDRITIERSLISRWGIQKEDKAGRTWVAGAAEWLRPSGPVADAPVGPSGVRFTLDTLATRRTVSRHVVRRLGQQKKLLFFLDDLHNASESTFEGFMRMHKEDQDQSYIIVATVRAEDVHLGTPAAERLRKLRDEMNGLAIDVTPLEPDTTRELLRKSLPLQNEAVDEAAKRSRGNPLFALQQLHAWALAGNMEMKHGQYHVAPSILSVRPDTTAELWDSRLTAVPEELRLAAYATAAFSSDLRKEVLLPLYQKLGLPAEEALFCLQRAEVLIPRGPGRYSWPHALLQEHLSSQLAQLKGKEPIYRAAAEALAKHPLAPSRRVVRQRVMNLLLAGDAEAGAHLLFHFLQVSWNGAREPLSTLSDLDLLRGRLKGASRAHQDRWRAESLRHVGRALEAKNFAERASAAFKDLDDQKSYGHCLRLLGHIGSELGNATEGRNSATKALEVFRREGDLLGQAQTEAALAEIGYLLGDFESARPLVEAGERHFASLDQPLGRGQCLLLSSWIEHSEGSVERSRKLALEARQEFERVGYRLGTAQADASLAHVEHRMLNLRNAQLGATDALTAFESLRIPRGQAACRRLLAMVGLDADDLQTARLNAEWSARIYGDLDDPWGVVESKVLQAQVALLEQDYDAARVLHAACEAMSVEEPEPHQHRLLSEAWLAREENNMELACKRIVQAIDVFPNRRRIGDHTFHLLGRLSRYSWPTQTHALLKSWRDELNLSSRAKPNSTITNWQKKPTSHLGN